MRIAFVTWCIPYPPDTGGKNRTYNLVKNLARRHQVDLHIPSYRPVDDFGDLASLCKGIEVYKFRTWTKREWAQRLLRLTPMTVIAIARPDAVAAMQRVLAERAYDLILVDELAMAPYAWKLHDTPRIMLRQKAEFLFSWDVALRSPWGKRKFLNLIESALLRLYEPKVWSIYRKGMVVSEQERDLFSSIDDRLELCIAPNGVDLELFELKPMVETKEPMLLYHGTMSYYPNVDAVFFFFDRIYPLIRQQMPAFKVMVVGRDPPPEVEALENKYDNVRVTGKVPDMRPYLEQSTVVMVPLRIGHGTRLKIPEAMAVGRPVVSTSIGCEGLVAQDGLHLLIADTPQAFADQVVRLARDVTLWRHLADNGRRLVEEAYSWESISAQVERFCCKVAEEKNRDGQ